jgi:3-phosphoshikimate 1-carboxyvinyltransferase
MNFNFGRGSKITPVKSVAGEIEVSPDKSISHRALILASLAKGQSVIKNMLEAEDCLNTLNTIKKSGINVKKEKSGDIIIEGNGRRGYRKPGRKL